MAQLTGDEAALWTAWKQASERVRALVAADILAATGLSDPDFGVLTRVVEIGDGSLRQSELAQSLGWHRSRLSHHLSRMEQRGLITRQALAEGGVEIRVTDTGRAGVAEARPIHAAAVREHLLRPLDPSQRETLSDALARLSQHAAAASTGRAAASTLAP
jgi:DNA-binding MarR family transcriptional regulator